MGEPEDFKKKTTVTYGLIIYVGVVMGAMGYLFASMEHNDRQAVKSAADNRLYTEQEVSGLRSDWERQNAILRERDIELVKRIEALEKYHKE